jgi:membrane-associated protease RseP (regulator of RpoE activity)
MKSTTRIIAVICLVVVACLILVSRGQSQPPGSQFAPAGVSSSPTVIHIHHHYYNPASPSASIISGYAPSTAWHYGYQAGTGTNVEPWKQNWGHLGFTGYLGQHGGGVLITPDSFPVFTGLVVDTLTPGGPAAKLGLVPGDFILKINGVKVDNYKQVTLLFDQTEDNPKATLTLDVWNPHTRRTQTLTAKIEK